MYELTANVLSRKMRDYEGVVNDKIEFYTQRLLYWRENTDKVDIEWADFLKRD